MPEFEQERSDWIYHSVRIKCRSRDDYAALANVVRQRLTTKTKSIYYPQWTPADIASTRWVSSLPRRSILPRYPIYIISKGRAHSRLTIKALNEMKVPYHVVIEPKEYETYATVVDRKKLLKLPNDSDPNDPKEIGRAHV